MPWPAAGIGTRRAIAGPDPSCDPFVLKFQLESGAGSFETLEMAQESHIAGVVDSTPLIPQAPPRMHLAMGCTSRKAHTLHTLRPDETRSTLCCAQPCLLQSCTLVCGRLGWCRFLRMLRPHTLSQIAQQGR